MKTFLRLLCMWHDWRAAVWKSRAANPKLSLDQEAMYWDMWNAGCKVMYEYHSRRHEQLSRELL
jgi:hypothetical protein